MRVLNQACEALIQKYSDNPSEYINLMYQHIERCGRTCYRSSDKITENSAKPFVERMIKSNHTAMLEHGTIYLAIIYNPEVVEERKHLSKYLANPYTEVICKILESDSVPVSEQKIGESIKVTKSIAYITTNYRVIVENNLQDDLKYLCKPTKYHKKRYTLYCTTALHCYKDLTRHRKFSFAIESTRYCNYSKTEKFGDMAFIIPTWINLKEGQYFDGKYGTPLFEEFLKSDTYNKLTERFILDLVGVERTYNEFIENGWQAQQAAEILPQCIKGDMIITGFEDDWKHLIDLRFYGTTGAPHPMVKELATLMKEELGKLGFNY